MLAPDRVRNSRRRMTRQFIRCRCALQGAWLAPALVGTNAHSTRTLQCWNTWQTVEGSVLGISIQATHAVTPESATRKLSRNGVRRDHGQCRFVPSNGFRSPAIQLTTLRKRTEW